MKYPQLVSPRAVNAISDWLVSRLEQLGVESPQIYTRLLLSLLQSSVQVNDPIEFSNLEAFFASRKGGHKRFHLPSDTETLKKLNAVQCLREIVSNEQEIVTIELLVDELCEKLKDIEKQTQNLRDEERFLIETHLNTDSLLQHQTNTTYLQYHQQHPTSNSNNNSNNNNAHNNNNIQHQRQHQHQSHYHQHHHHHHHQHQQYHHHNHHNNQQQQQQQVAQICTKPNTAAFNTDSKRHHVQSTSSTTCDSLNDLDNDPKKRYFRAFPALSKEMEDSFRIWRRNAKSLTWPIVGRSIVIDNNLNNSSASLSSSSASSIISSSNFGPNCLTADKSVEKKSKAVGVGVLVPGHQLGNKVSADCGASDGQQHQGVAAAAVAAALTTSGKKKSKRRRNQALSKGKVIQNLRKLSVGTASNSIGGTKYHQYTHHRNSSPTWDTDFKGCWEMGPDLIKEFLSRQDGTKRNHSSSDSMDHEDLSEHGAITSANPSKNEENPVMELCIDLSFCFDDDDDVPDVGVRQQHQSQSIEKGIDYVDEDYNDSTFASVSALTPDSCNPKRLYQREGRSQKTLTSGSNVLMGNILETSNKTVDPSHFQRLKAKFNSSMEALWKDEAPTPNINTQQQQQFSLAMLRNSETPLNLNNQLSAGGISTAFYANAMAPFKKDLWNYWSNFQQQQFDHSNNKLSATASTSSMMATMIDDSSVSSATGADIGNSSDYYSMPSNLNDFDKSVGSVRRRNDAGGASLGEHTPPINVFLRNSIWSTSRDSIDAIASPTGGAASASAADESFPFKVWHSNKKLSELDVGNAVDDEKMPTRVDDNVCGVHNTDFHKSKDPSSKIMVNNTNVGANLQFPPYQNLKWSEGINAGPPYGIALRAHNDTMQSLNSNASLRADNNYASFSSAASISGATWEAPAYGQNSQPDLKSWCASNPMSLTEMYGNDVCDSIVNNQPLVEEDEANQAENALGPAVTLSNHCANSSGFVAYSRIKQCGIIQPQMKPLQHSSSAARLPKDFFRSSAEEENLLNSERTHFHPIENFVDGHTFDINNALETVEFERTSSGLMRYESEEYLEYTRSDIYMADEEVATNSTSLVKYGRRPNEDRDKKDKFIIKFRVKRCGETACQTEEQDFKLASAKIAELPSASSTTTLRTFSPALEVNSMFSNAFSLRRQENNEAIMAAVTKAVAAAAKAAAENHLNAGHFCWQPMKTISATASASETAIVTTNTKETNPLWRPENSICDEVDFCKIDGGGAIGQQQQQQQQHLDQSWSMQEVEKQCHKRHGSRSQHHQQLLQQQQQEGLIKRKFNTKVDIERREESSLDNNSLHTLWSVCAVCNSCDGFGKSMPADRLLRDELQLEADEIMSDLRHMQDLYIGESDVLNDPIEGNNSTEENAMMSPADGDKMFDYINKDAMDSKSMKDDKNPPNIKDTSENTVEQDDLVQVSMLQKVNQLIEDLLKTENSRALSRETQENDKTFIKQTQAQLNGNNIWNFRTDHQDRTKNSWQFTEQKDHNMWQQKPAVEQLAEGDGTSKNNETFEKPMKLFKQVDDEEEKLPHGESTQYGEIVNWKHDHLAKLWQQSMPTSNQIEEALIKHYQAAELKTTNHMIDENSRMAPRDGGEGGAEGDCQNQIEEKTVQNLTQNTYEPLTPPSSTNLERNNYKVVEQFLNNSSAKMKLVANRKRRHSASQNFYQQQHLQFNNTSTSTGNANGNNDCKNSNNNNDTISDLNASGAATNAKGVSPYDNTNLLPSSNLNAEEQPTKQTIITCKYWTAATNGTQSSLDSAAAAMMLLAAATNANNDDNMVTAATGDNLDHQQDLMQDESMFGNTISCLIDKNASILKHVTMMARPLTR